MTQALVMPQTGAPSQDGAPVSRPPLRVVFDTNVLLSLFVFADSSFAPFRAKVERGEWIAYSNEACLAEFQRVLGYPIFRLDPESRQQAYAAWTRLLTRPGPPPTQRVALPVCKDRDDQKFLELTRDASADWLVTADKALLKLARRDKLRGLFQILTPEAVLARL